MITINVSQSTSLALSENVIESRKVNCFLVGSLKSDFLSISVTESKRRDSWAQLITYWWSKSEFNVRQEMINDLVPNSTHPKLVPHLDKKKYQLHGNDEMLSWQVILQTKITATRNSSRNPSLSFMLIVIGCKIVTFVG